MSGLGFILRAFIFSPFFLPTVEMAPVPLLAQPQGAAQNPAQSITIPAGTRIDATLIRPVSAATASPGETVYAETSFPVVVGGSTVVPPGTFVEARLQKLTRPTRRSNRAALQILFTRLIFANGYVAALQPPTAQSSALDAPSGTLMVVAVQVSTRNDLLLDNGAQIQFTLAAPLALDPQSVAAAIPLTRAPVPGQFRTASRCTTIPGSPGTPGSPEIPCPMAPLVLSSTPVPGKP